ncbi:ferritin-like domain-containing protein [Halobacillus sp. BBL2006]|uniref:ferritin-like domain-containing protein n=1 Tax=Halobacillus sp. BBL2006 TaxID=1543706 RepID=UPI00068CFBD8|nr:ferritin-like domain-containing protein [Halobacillus sp. BBL2006]
MQNQPNQFISMLESAIEDEWNANDFYKRLGEDTSNRMFKDYIKHAEEDELKHYKLFQHLHYQLTGQYHQFKPKKITYQSFEDGVKKAQKGEFEAFEMYRDMLFMIPNQMAYQPLFIAMTDEMEHATRFGTILGRLK